MVNLATSMLWPKIGPIAPSLGPRILCKAWTGPEDALIMESYSKWGASWALISRQLPGRSPKECRHRWLTRSILPSFQKPAMPEPIIGTENAKRKAAISEIISKAHEMGLRPSPAFPLQTISKPLTKAQLSEWEIRMKGFEPINTSKWVRFPEEARIPLPFEQLASQLPRHIPRWRILRKGWSSLEDAVLREAYEFYGPNWIAIHYALPKRTWQECRQRLTMLSLRWNCLPSA